VVLNGRGSKKGTTGKENRHLEIEEKRLGKVSACRVSSHGRSLAGGKGESNIGTAKKG